MAVDDKWCDSRIPVPDVTCISSSYAFSWTSGCAAVHGVDLPAGSVVALDTLSQAVDPALVGDDAKEFKPERFLQSAVEARAGTAASMMDHSFFSDPFSQGARKCPGRRVANFEALALLAQFDFGLEV
jgi:cytochrome P450